MLALNDFIADQANLPLLDLAHIIKIEYPELSIEKQRVLIQKCKGKVNFLAEIIETREEHRQALELGYDLFQGFFFSKPAMISSKEIMPLNLNLFHIMDELNAIEPDYSVIASFVRSDLGLSYKLLKLVNSVYIGPGQKIKSIQQALTFFGVNELYQRISLVMLREVEKGGKC